MSSVGRAGLNHDRLGGDEMRKMIVNASLALGVTARIPAK